MTRWRESEPRRFERDRREIAERFPELLWFDAGAGGWRGRLPVWPFTRPSPPGLEALTSGLGLEVELRYFESYPMTPPLIYPLDPEPELMLRTQHRWHLSGDGSLCQLISAGQWSGRESVIDLLLKAASWRVEYALMRKEVLKAMSENGIVDDPVHDELIAKFGEETACTTSQSS
jgi:hypothetical protein